MRGILVEKNNCADIQSNYSKLAGWLLEAKREIHVYSYYICLYVGKNTNQITFQQKKEREICRFNYSVYMKTVIFTTTDYLNQHTGQL